MRWKPLPVIGGAYPDDSREWSSADVVNWLLVKAEREGTRSPSKYRNPPGLSAFCDLGSGLGIRGLHDVEGRLFAVSGSTLYEATNGTVVSRGTIPGVSRVSMAHNQVAGGNQLAIANGSSGYVFDTRDNTLVQITDPGFIGAKSFDFIDQFIVGVDPTGRRAFTSDLADATSYNTLDQYEAESAPDKIVGQIVTHREWWLMGSRTIEPFVDTGAGTGTFQRQSGVVIERGLAATHARVLLDNSVFWLGDDGSLYRANGYSPQRVSTLPIESSIASSDLSKAFCFAWEDQGHKVAYFTFPDGQTWGYDVASGEWHRRKSYGLNRWRINDLVKWNGQWIAGDYSNGKLYKLDWSAFDEVGADLERRRVTTVLADGGNRVLVNGLKFTIDTGQPASGSTYMDMRYSKDGGHNWSDWRKLPMGKTGSFVQTVETRGIGQCRQITLDIRVTDALKADLLEVSAMIEACDS
ncbi:packaged DNA stabilization protein [Dyella sp. KRB-257]|uniref:packaged DNA stabilization protein n=1 Tax=Dyella sp. KRB-257 TaxID=3400915 RepID=UPI003C09370B